MLIQAHYAHAAARRAREIVHEIGVGDDATSAAILRGLLECYEHASAEEAELRAVLGARDPDGDRMQGESTAAAARRRVAELRQAAVEVENLRAQLDERDELATQTIDRLTGERDEARAALASEPARIAAAEMARDVAWVIAIDSQCGGADVDDGIACATAEALGVTERVALRLLDGSPTTDEHIAAAIRAARGQA